MADPKDQTEATVTDAMVTPDPEVIAPKAAPEAEATADVRPAPEVMDAEIVETPEPAARPPEPQKIIERVERRGGFVSMLLGGIAAAGIGFGMARYVLPDDFPFPKAGQTDLAANLNNAVTEAKNADLVLAGRIEALENGPDLTPVMAEIDATKASLADALAKVDALGAQLDGLTAQVAELRNRPVTEGAGPAAVAAYEAELAKLQAAMAEQRASLESLVNEATAKRDAAQMTEQEAMVRNSLTRIRIAIENGGPFQAELANLIGAGVDVPAALTDKAEAGVPTLAALREAYPTPARAALAASRAGGTDGGIGSVLTSLLGARSLEPRAGDDPDAILSRAEAALREGRMTDAVAEVESLPEVARIEMSGWLQLATERATTLAALDALAAQATAN